MLDDDKFIQDTVKKIREEVDDTKESYIRMYLDQFGLTVDDIVIKEKFDVRSGEFMIWIEKKTDNELPEDANG